MIRCPKCYGQHVLGQPMTVSQDHYCVQCGYAWDDPSTPAKNLYQQAWQNPFAGSYPGDPTADDQQKASTATAPTLDQGKTLVNLLAPQDRQALYEYLRNIHGCRIW